MTAAVARHATHDDHALLADYLTHVSVLGLGDGALRGRLAIARGFLAVHPDLQRWMDQPTVVQKTYIRVDEEGTEAAAVTGGVMDESAGPPPLLVDGPSAFTVGDRDTGTILFIGTVHDPRA